MRVEHLAQRVIAIVPVKEARRIAISTIPVISLRVLRGRNSTVDMPQELEQRGSLPVAGSTRHSCSLRILTLQQVELTAHCLERTEQDCLHSRQRDHQNGPAKKGAHTAIPDTKYIEVVPWDPLRQPCEVRFLSVYCNAH